MCMSIYTYIDIDIDLLTWRLTTKHIFLTVLDFENRRPYSLKMCCSSLLDRA